MNASKAIEALPGARRTRDWRVWLGLGLTALWLFLGLRYVELVIGWDRFAAQPADALGSFLEGAFAPLAFLWLVIGFFLQHKELAGNNEAIRLQYREMRRSAEQAEIQARAIAASELHQRQETLLLVWTLVRQQLGSISGLLSLLGPLLVHPRAQAPLRELRGRLRPHARRRGGLRPGGHPHGGHARQLSLHDHASAAREPAARRAGAVGVSGTAGLSAEGGASRTRPTTRRSFASSPEALVGYTACAQRVRWRPVPGVPWERPSHLGGGTMQGHSLTCTFCKRSEHQVRKLVAGPGVYICDGCVEIAHRIVRAEEPPPAQTARWRRALERIAGLFGAARARVGFRHVAGVRAS
jgi:hypothetical protein